MAAGTAEPLAGTVAGIAAPAGTAADIAAPRAGTVAGIAAPRAGTVADMAGIAGRTDRFAAGQQVAVPPVFARNRPKPQPQDIAAHPAARHTVPASRPGGRRNLVRAVLVQW